jgi:magnesium chelatase family protein
MNPCPCGYLGDPTHACRCDPAAVERYRARVSGPLLDRIDIHLAIPALAPGEFAATGAEEPSAAIRERVEAARARQAARFRADPATHANAQMGAREVRRFCRLSAPAEALMRQAVTRLGLSARAYHRVLKVARTIADLAGSTELDPAHVSEAIQYRSLERRAAAAAHPQP